MQIGVCVHLSAPVARDLPECPADRSNSIFVGDAAGRPTDHASTDRKWALNVEIPFYTPEVSKVRCTRCEQTWLTPPYRNTSSSCQQRRTLSRVSMSRLCRANVSAITLSRSVSEVWQLFISAPRDANIDTAHSATSNTRARGLRRVPFAGQVFFLQKTLRTVGLRSHQPRYTAYKREVREGGCGGSARRKELRSGYVNSPTNHGGATC